MIVVIKLRVLHVFDEYLSSTLLFRKESRNFDSYLGSQDCLILFEPISVDCRNEITRFGCVFVNTIVENEFDGFRVRSVSCYFRVMGVRSVSCDMSSFSCYNVNVRSLVLIQPLIAVDCCVSKTSLKCR